MSDQQGRAIGGSCLGGVAGLILGVLLGGFLGSGSHSDLPKNGPIDPKPIDACMGFVGMVLGAGIGGLIGTLGGAVLGTAVATQTQKSASAPMLDQDVAKATNVLPSVQESREAELAQLRARIAELEGKTAPPGRSENIQGFRAEPGAAADRPRE